MRLPHRAAFAWDLAYFHPLTWILCHPALPAPPPKYDCTGNRTAVWLQEESHMTPGLKILLQYESRHSAESRNIRREHRLTDDEVLEIWLSLGIATFCLVFFFLSIGN